MNLPVGKGGLPITGTAGVSPASATSVGKVEWSSCSRFALIAGGTSAVPVIGKSPFATCKSVVLEWFNSSQLLSLVGTCRL